jgi:Porin PorA
MRRVIGLTVTGLGSFLVAFALLLRLWVPGQVITFPLNEYAVTTLSGNNVSYFSPTNLKEYTGVTATSTQTVEGDVKSGSSSIAVWGSFTALEDTTNHAAIQYASQRSAFDRRSGELVNCCAAAVGANTQVRQTGQGFRWPFGTQHQTYQVFDVTLLRPVAFDFAGTGTIDGMAADKFVEHVVNRRFGEQTLPGPLVGLKQQATVTLPEYLTATNTYWIDPLTGTPIDVTLDQTVVLRDSTGASRLVLLGGRMSETPASVRAAVARADQSHSKIGWIQDIGPLIGILLGIVLLVFGIGLVWRAQPPWEPAYDDDEGAELARRASSS